MKGIKRVMPVRSLPPAGTQRGAYIWRDVGGICWVDNCTSVTPPGLLLAAQTPGFGIAKSKFKILFYLKIMSVKCFFK